MHPQSHVHCTLCHSCRDKRLRLECADTAAHAILRGWVCRDIKPENIFLTAALKFKLGDFGLAIRADEELPFTRSGTLDYMAPEVSIAAHFAPRWQCSEKQQHG